jgi:hypothetical protein
VRHSRKLRTSEGQYVVRARFLANPEVGNVLTNVVIDKQIFGRHQWPPFRRVSDIAFKFPVESTILLVLN